MSQCNGARKASRCNLGTCGTEDKTGSGFDRELCEDFASRRASWTRPGVRFSSIEMGLLKSDRQTVLESR